MSKTSFFILCFVSIVVAGFVFLFLEIEKVKTNQAALNVAKVTTSLDSAKTIPESSNPANISRSEIKEVVEELLASTSAQVAPASSLPPSTTKKSLQVTFIPISQSGATTSTEWQDISGSDFYVALVDYGTPKSVTFEANLKSANGSGPAYARLYNVTSGVAVSGSEVSSSSTSYTLKSSGGLNLWSGNNLYRVQIKSHDSQEASFGNGRIKILY